MNVFMVALGLFLELIGWLFRGSALAILLVSACGSGYALTFHFGIICLSLSFLGFSSLLLAIASRINERINYGR